MPLPWINPYGTGCENETCSQVIRHMISGEGINYEPWMGRVVSNNVNRQCFRMKSIDDGYLIESNECHDRPKPVCQFHCTGPVLPSNQCGDNQNFRPLLGHYYQHLHASLSWEELLNTCVQRGGKLPSIRLESEFAAVNVLPSTYT